MSTTLWKYLMSHGWLAHDAAVAAEAFSREPGRLSVKARAAAATVRFMNDEEHDYEGEMLDCILEWIDLLREQRDRGSAGTCGDHIAQGLPG